MWNLEVNVPGRTTYIVHAIIGGVESVDTSPCWQVTFLPGNGAPVNLKDKRHRLSVNQKTGLAVRALKVADKQPILIEKAGEASFVTMLADGMPIEWFNVAAGKYPIAGTMRMVEIRKTDLGDHYEIEQSLFDNDVEQWTIRQRWGVDEKWWHTYQRIEKNEVTLIAQRLNAAPFKSQAAANKDRDPKVQAAKFPLRMDPALRAKIGNIRSDTEFAELMERLRLATKYKLTLAESLAHHDPKFSNVTMKDATAWMAMERLTKQDLDDGQWIKTEDGYRLEGVSKSLRPLPPKTFPWLPSLAGVAIVVTALAAYYFYRRRTKRLAANAPKG